jgi:hypothetical protein
MAIDSPDQHRELLSVSFEPADAGFVYFQNAWSHGILVTEEEREAYLAIPMAGSRRAWHRSIANRQTVPARAYWPTLHKLLAKMPRKTAVVGVLIGVPLVLSGYSATNILLGLGYIPLGCIMVAYAVGVALARLSPPKSDVT